MIYNLFLTTLQLGHPGSRVAKNGFVINEQVALLKKKIAIILVFIFSKWLYTMSNMMDCDPGQTNSYLYF